MLFRSERCTEHNTNVIRAIFGLPVTQPVIRTTSRSPSRVPSRANTPPTPITVLPGVALVAQRLQERRASSPAPTTAVAGPSRTAEEPATTVILNSPPAKPVRSERLPSPTTTQPPPQVAQPTPQVAQPVQTVAQVAVPAQSSQSSTMSGSIPDSLVKLLAPEPYHGKDPVAALAFLSRAKAFFDNLPTAVTRDLRSR